MKNTMLNRKLTVAILTVFLVICAVPDASAGFFDDLFGVIGDVVETVATVATTFVDVAVAVVDVAVGVVEITVGVVDLTVRLAANLVGHTGCVLATAFDPHGAILASGGCDYDVLLLDILTGGITLTLRHVSAVLSLAYCAVDGCMLASGTEDGLLYLWIPDTGELKTTLTGYTGAVLRRPSVPLITTSLPAGVRMGPFAYGMQRRARTRAPLTDIRTASRVSRFVLMALCWPAGVPMGPFDSGMSIRVRTS